MSRAIILADIDTIGGPANIAEIAGTTSRLIATSSAGSLNVALAAVKAGAFDFLPKPIGAKALIQGLEAAVSSWNGAPGPTARPQPPPLPAVRSSAEPADFAGFVGRSPAMQAVYEQIRRMAPSSAPVFITGESGTGKEVTAEAIHAHAGPEGRPFVALNCSAIPKELMESEIFGHVRGAFTGASENRAGAAEMADGGTLFLDELAEMDLGLQAKLLRFIQTGSFRRVGGNELKRVDLRIVSATNRDPFAEVEAGRFRADLFYRLHVLPIALPALRERPEDILPLAEAFLTRYAEEEGRGFHGFDPEAAALIRASSWPGNVRQLQNVVRRIVVLHDGSAVTSDMLPPGLSGPPSPATATGEISKPRASAPDTILPFRDQERMIIEAAVAAFDGNIPRAAAALEISASTIYRKRQAWLDRLSA
ncbi:MAG: sigma-54-dependent Fis family transcriptional regulator [Bauldia sp.]|nr:sigma-54-dependent Fis family transcriptional regulator [Bauldia sp.]